VTARNRPAVAIKMSKVMRLIAILLWRGCSCPDAQRPDELMRAVVNGAGQVAAGK